VGFGSGGSDDAVRAEDRSGSVYRKVSLPEVDPSGVNRLGDVGTIVDNEGYGGVGTDRSHVPGFHDLILNAPMFLAELNRIGPAPDGQPGKISVRMVLLKMKIGEDMQTSD